MADIIPREFIELLLAKIDLVDLIHSQLPLQKKSGNNYFARCPFHQEKSASFSVSQPKQFYYCFGCGAHGNAIDFLMQHEHLSFPEAVESLASQAGMEVPHTQGQTKKNDSLQTLYGLMDKAADYFYNQMRQQERAIHYLKKREISGIIARDFCLGYAAPGWNHLIDALGSTALEKQQLESVGLIIKKEDGHYYDRFRDRIMFPIHDYRGRIIGFGGRILDQGEPKYLNSPETVLFQKGHELYGLYQALKINRTLDKAIIVEGYMDVIALFQHGITNAVATLGTATTHHHIKRLTRYTNEIIFCFDGDNAGRTAAWRALNVIFPMMEDNLQIRFLFLPEGEDPDTLVRQQGKAAFLSALKDAPSLSAFFFQTLGQQADLQTMEGRARFAALALSHIKDLRSGIFEGILLEELSKRTRVAVNKLREQLKKPNEINEKNLTEKPVEKKTYTKLHPPIRHALTLLIQHPSLSLLVEETLPPSDLPGAAFLSKLIEILKERPHITTGGLLEYFRGHEEEGFVAKLAQSTQVIPESGIKSEFMGTIRQLTQMHYDSQINRLLAKAAQGDLTLEEKVDLSDWIAQKKQFLARAHDI